MSKDMRNALILSDAEACRRLALLGELRGALAGLGVRSVVARRHRLVLRYNTAPCEPSGLTDPRLHVLAGSRPCVVSTDGTTFTAEGVTCAAGDVPAAAAAIMLSLPADVAMKGSSDQ
jgi:hypothetical protein